MKLAFYSSALHAPNSLIDEAVFRMLPQNREQHFAIILADSDARPYVEPLFPQYLAPFVSATYDIIDLKKDSAESVKQILGRATLISFSGGNTYSLLNNLRTFGLISLLTELARKDVVFEGSSAGAIVMTPTIEVAGYPSFDADDNNVQLTDFSALNWVKFEVTPHYQGTDDEITEFRQYSLKSGRPLYALSDTTAILIDGQKERLFGNIVMFDNGELIKVQCAC
jgi:dipeptidase E